MVTVPYSQACPLFWVWTQKYNFAFSPFFFFRYWPIPTMLALILGAFSFFALKTPHSSSIAVQVSTADSPFPFSVRLGITAYLPLVFPFKLLKKIVLKFNIFIYILLLALSLLWILLSNWGSSHLTNLLRIFTMNFCWIHHTLLWKTVYQKWGSGI